MQFVLLAILIFGSLFSIAFFVNKYRKADPIEKREIIIAGCVAGGLAVGTILILIALK